MAKGGARIGAGRKPGRSLAVVVGKFAGAPAEPDPGLLEPPAELPAEAAACWRRFAPSAVERRTLIAAKVHGFRELCIRQAYIAALDEKIGHLGVASREALPYLETRRKLAVLLSSSLKEFDLTSFGKPATSEKPAKAANPFAAVGG